MIPAYAPQQRRNNEGALNGHVRVDADRYGGAWIRGENMKGCSLVRAYFPQAG